MVDALPPPPAPDPPQLPNPTNSQTPSLTPTPSRRHSYRHDESASGVRYIKLNQATDNQRAKFPSNQLRSAKYTPISLVPKALFEQFRRVSNFYFLFVGMVSFVPAVSPYSPWASVSPLFIVVGFGFARDVYEDIQRTLEDRRQNSQGCVILDDKGETKDDEMGLKNIRFDSSIPMHRLVPSRDIKVGDIVHVQKGEVFPCDLALLYTSGADDVAYVSTSNLDGESSLKRVNIVNTSWESDGKKSPAKLLKLQGTLTARKPTAALHEFSASLTLSNKQSIPLTADNLLLRGSILRNTESIYGLVVYTGMDTKVALNMRKPVSKLGTIEIMLNHVVLVMFLFLAILIGAASLSSGILQGRYGQDQWYMADFRNFSATSAGARGLGTFLILFTTFIPSSLFVTLEFVRVVQAIFIIADPRLRSNKIEGGGVAARSMNLNETLGEVEHILSDKTGTLTENDMRFVACSTGGKIYNIDEEKDCLNEAVKNNVTPVKDLLLGMAICHSVVVDPSLSSGGQEEDEGKKRKTGNGIQIGSSKEDGSGETVSPSNGNGLKSDVINSELREDRNSDGESMESMVDNYKLLEYQGQSPDEVSLVTSARTYGVSLLNRSVETIRLDKFGVQEEYTVLSELEFNSDRKRMSLIVRSPKSNKIELFCKGADNVMLKLITSLTPEQKIEIESDINEFAKMGLRTLVYARKEIEESEFEKWNLKYQRALNLVDETRDYVVSEVCNEIEEGLDYAATTAVEDRLQDMVPETVKCLREAGVKLWILTGDKRETAENIGYSANLLDRHMDVIHIQGNTSEQIEHDLRMVLEAHSGNSLLKYSGKRRSSSMRKRLTRKLSSAVYSKNEKLIEQEIGVIIDGVSLQYVIENHSKLFMKLSDICKVVICCRVTPLQKALVVKLVKTERKVITLAIGDGGNDVSMIQEAHIGVGIFGKEGTQAARSSDYSISKFKHLLRLMIIHGRFSSIRTAGLINLSFYKNVFFTMTQVYFQFFCLWSGQTFHDQWITAAFNVIITSASPFLYGIFERDLEESTVAKFPSIYKQSHRIKSLSLRTISEYSLLYGIWHSLIVFFGTFGLFGYLKIPFADGKDHGLFLVSLVCSTLVTFMTLFKFLLHSYTWNWIVLLGILISFVIYIISIPLSVLVLADYPMEGQLTMLFSSPTFWLAIFVVMVASFFVDFIVIMYRKIFKPNVIDRLQRWEHLPQNLK